MAGAMGSRRSQQAVKNRLHPFVPLLITTLDSDAWKSLSHGAKALYVALRRRVPKGRNRAYLSYRQAEAEIRSSQRKIGEWFKELQHYGFIVIEQPGYLGVEGKGKAPVWRLTELGHEGHEHPDQRLPAMGWRPVQTTGRQTRSEVPIIPRKTKPR